MKISNRMALAGGGQRRRGDTFRSVSEGVVMSNAGFVRVAALVLLLSTQSAAFHQPWNLREAGRAAVVLHSSYYPSSGSDASVNGGSAASRGPYFQGGRRNEFDQFPDRDFDPYIDGRGGRFDIPPPPPPMNNYNAGVGGGGYDPEIQKYFRRNNNMNNGMYGDVPMSGERIMGMPGNEFYDPRARPPPPPPGSTFSNPNQVGRQAQQQQRYYQNKAPDSAAGVYDAEVFRDDEYYERIARLFPVLSRIQGVPWQGHLQYVNGDLQVSPASRQNTKRPIGLRYDLDPDGYVFMTITLGGRRIEMRGQRLDNDRYGRGGASVSQRQGGTIRLDPMNEQDPNFMELIELDPDTVLINEIDRFSGKVVLTASLSLANPDELVQISHDVGDMDMPIQGHQIWTLARPGSRQQQRLAAAGSSSSLRADQNARSSNSFAQPVSSDGVKRTQVTTGIPQSITPSNSYRSEFSSSSTTGNYRGRPAMGNLGRIYPVLSKFAGVTWEGDCRQVNGDLRLSGIPRALYGGTRYDIYEDGSVVLTTFLRTNGRVESIEMRGGRVNGPGSPIQLDMDRLPHSMIITEVAPNTLIMNEVHRETGRILFTSSLFLAGDNEVVQVSHQVSGRDPRMPIDQHQVWRLAPARDGYEMETEWRNRDQFLGRAPDRTPDVRGGRSAWSRGADLNRGGPMYQGGASTNAVRRSINGLLTEPGSRSRYDEDQLWLLNRSPEEMRDRFRDKFNSWEVSRDVIDDPDFVESDIGPLRQDRLLEPELRDAFPVLSQITGIDWQGTCRYIIGDTKPDSIMLLQGGMRYDLSRDGVCTMTTTLDFADGRTREVRMRGYRESSSKYSNSMRLYPVDDEDDSVYTILTEISPDTILLNEIDGDTNKVIYTASLSISNDRNELVQVTHELGDGVRMPVEGHQVWRMKRFGGTYERTPGIRTPAGGWTGGSSSSTKELFPVLSRMEGTGWQGTFRFVNGDLERQLNFEATGKMWYDLNRNGTCVLTIVSSLADGSSRYVQMKGERGKSAQEPLRLDPVDKDGTNYMIITELPPDTVLLSEIDRFTGKLVSTASLSIYKDEVIQVSHEMGNNSSRLDGHQIARLRRAKDRSSTSRGSMSYLLNGELEYPTYQTGDSLVDLFPVLNQIDGINWQGYCKVIDGNLREEKAKPMLSGGMRYDLHRNGTCTMTSVLMHPDGRTHQIRLQGTRVGKSNKRSIRLDPIDGDSPFYTVLTEVPPDTILLNEVDKATNKVIFTASVSIASPDELIQISHDVDANGINEEGHKIWRLKRSPVLGRNVGRAPTGSASYFRGQGFRPGSSGGTRENFSGGRPPEGFRPPTSGGTRENFSGGRPPSGGATPGGFDASTSGPPRGRTPDVPFGQPKPRDPNLLFDY